jgi:prepilin-type N-terminal cleavage/methylation domain-containing protein
MNKNKAFTLVELLIASSIFAVVMVALYVSFSSGVFGYRNIDERLEVYQKSRHILDRLNLDLRNSFAYSSGDTKFSGSNSEIRFFTLVDDYQDEVIIRNYAYVYYYLDAPSHKLMRLCRRNQESLKPDSQIKAEELSWAVKNISFTYIYLDNGIIKEKDAWDDAGNLPVAVKVQLSFSPQEKYIYNFERTIYIAKAVTNSPATP